MLLILGVPNALAFAVLAGFADIIPLVGAFIAVSPPTFAAFEDSPTKALIVLGLLALYQQFEDRILVPRVYGSTLNLPPLIVLIAVLAGASCSASRACCSRCRPPRRAASPSTTSWSSAPRRQRPFRPK